MSVFRVANPLDLPGISLDEALTGSAEGVYVEPPGEPRTFHAYKPDFYDDPDNTGLFGTFRDHVLTVPPIFLAAASNVTLVGFRWVLTRDGTIFNDAGSLREDWEDGYIKQLSPPHGEDTCLKYNPDKSGFTYAFGVRPRVHLAGRVVLLTSNEPSNFGSFIFRVLPKLIATGHLPPDIRFLVYAAHSSFRQFLTLAGIPENRIIRHDPNIAYDIDRVLVPSLRHPNAFIDTESSAFFADLAARCGPSSLGRRIYVSRYDPDNTAINRRVMVNEAELIDRLAALGFDIIRPEIMSAQDQVAAFAGADFVVGPCGPGMFNTVFCKPGTRIINIESEPHWIFAHICLFASSRLRYGIFAGSVLDPTSKSVHLPWRLNIPALLQRIAACVEEDSIQSRPIAVPAAPKPTEQAGKWNSPMKCAALIIASRNPAGIGALSSYFAALGADMFVHVDAKIDEAPFREAAAAAGGNVNFLSDRTLVFWRGFSMVEATMKLLRSAAGKGPYDKYMLISDDSLPLLTPAALTKRLAATDDFVAIGPQERFRSRYTGFYMFDSFATQVRWIPLEEREITPDAVARFLRLDALRRIGKKPIRQLFHGSQWWCLGASSVARVLDVWATDTWRRESFEFSEVPDEHYIQTIIGEAGPQPHQQFMHTDWSTPTPPRIFKTPAELAEAATSGSLFIRKVDLNNEDLESYLASLIGRVPAMA